MGAEEVTKTRKWDELAPVYGYKPHTLAVVRELNERAELLKTFEREDITFEIKRGREVLWLLARWNGGGGIAMRGVYSPDGDITAEITREEENRLDLTVTGTTTGSFRVQFDLLDREKALFRWRVEFTPVVDFLMPPQPWNIYPIDEHGNPLETQGIVHAAQRGSAAGVLYFTLTQPQTGTVLYFQNLTALNPYCEATKTTPNTVVGEEWPGLGFQPPPTDRNPLPGGVEVSVCDAFVRLTSNVPENDRRVASLFLEMLGEIYLHVPKPDTQYHDWPRKAEETLRDITYSSKVTTEDQGYLYLHPYTASEYPDSMVQLTVLLPLHEYADWCGKEDLPIISRLREGVRQFYDPKMKTMRRYLATVGEEKNALEVDSWYLYHPLTNLARLAKDGDEEARDLFFHSVEFGIKAAHHFEYWWPVQFNIETLEVITGDRKPGESGQTDVPGLYAYVMLAAYELDDDPRYLEEAKSAIHALEGLSFSIGYQFNNVAWGITACLKLWKITGDDFYRDQSYVFMASFFHNTFLWECDFGPAKHYPTFMGVTCLHDGAYMAAYEEYEAFTAFHEALSLAGDDLPYAPRMLMAEYCKYALNHAWYYYPGELPEEILSTEVRNGHIDRSLAIPLEDLNVDWENAGAVGQEVYGAGSAFAYVTRSYHRLSNAPFLLYCDYPIYALQNSDDQCVEFQVQGESDHHCRLRIIPKGDTPLLRMEVRLHAPGDKKAVEGQSTPEGHREYFLPGGHAVTVRWAGNEKTSE